MTKSEEFEIPEHLRQMAEQSLGQAQSAYQKLLETAKQAQGAMSVSSEAVASSFKEFQDTALSFTEKNMKANFDLANELIKAKNLQEALEIQSSFASKQMELYARQTQKLTELLAQATQNAQPKA